MRTIYAHNPTPEELEEITGSSTTSLAEYERDRDSQFFLLDLAILFYIRNDQENFNSIIAEIPALWQEYQLGFDCIQVAQ